MYTFMIYDIIIIGSGIAGLYSAYKILQESSSVNILILEKKSKKLIGGRAGNEMFQGVPVVRGAGVGRSMKDHLLLQLIQKLNVPYTESISKANYQYTPNCSSNFVKKTILNLKKVYKKVYKNYPNKMDTFKTFAINIIGIEKYKQFIICAGYTDYENSDIYDVLYNYGFEDNYSDLKIISVSWSSLINKLCEKIGYKNIRTSTNVLRIKSNNNNDSIDVYTNKGVYRSNKIIVATDISTLRKLFPKNKIYKEIHGQPFLRVYAKFSKVSIEIMKQCILGMTIVSGPLHKIIPIQKDKGIYMIAYTDNKDALYLKDKDKTFFSKLVAKALGLDDIRITALKKIFWKNGTHYYEPLKNYNNRNQFIQKAQHPEKNILVVGEVVSKHQGWIEGALESTINI